MKTKKNKGLGLIWIVAVLAMIPVILAVLSTSTIQLMHETQRQLSAAQADNLMLSAANWANANAAQILNTQEKKVITPDLSALNIPNSTCRIEVLSKADSRAEIHIFAEVYHLKQACRLEKTLQIAPIQ
jgi:hypothetical protein